MCYCHRMSCTCRPSYVHVTAKLQAQTDDTYAVHVMFVAVSLLGGCFVLLPLCRSESLQKYLCEGVKAGGTDTSCSGFYCSELAHAHYSAVQICCKVPLRAYCQTARAVFLVHNSASSCRIILCLTAVPYVSIDLANSWQLGHFDMGFWCR